MSATIIHKAASRGHSVHGWLDSWHTFSFAGYYDPERIHFGALRVLNDDTVLGGAGFDLHPHDNMEIISIPLEGELEHTDSEGHTSVIRYGDVQVMTAGTGIFHSEYNRNKDTKLRFLQIWVFPDKKQLKPRYDQVSMDLDDRHNRLQQILSPDGKGGGAWIHQKAWFHIGKFDRGSHAGYVINVAGNGVYIFVLSGAVRVGSELLSARDGMGIQDAGQLNFEAVEDSEFLVMEVPMNV